MVLMRRCGPIRRMRHLTTWLRPRCSPEIHHALFCWRDDASMEARAATNSNIKISLTARGRSGSWTLRRASGAAATAGYPGRHRNHWL